MARRSNNRVASKQNPNSNSAKARNQHNQSSSKAKAKIKASSVEIFTATFCPHCQDAKMYMKVNKIKFIEHNLERAGGSEKKFLALGGKKIPLLVVKGKILRSWNQASFEKAYKG